MQLAGIGLGSARLPFLELPELDDVPLRGPAGCELRHAGLEGEARLEHLLDAHPDVREVHHDGIDHRVDLRLGDDQTAAGAAPHRRDLPVLDEADGLPEHGPTHAVLLQQLGF